ncbi:MAG: hypothetical protein N3A56_04300 [Thermodesulfobacteriaceae bacterium]|nr:hypothetical protein [Thermodesulfobacteriaceae bacterium]
MEQKFKELGKIGCFYLGVLLILGAGFFLFTKSLLLSFPLANRTTLELEDLQRKNERILEEILASYQKGNYERVKNLAKKLSPYFILRAEENLILAESFLKTGEPDKTLILANKVVTVKRGTREACLAESLSIKALLVLEKFSEAQGKISKFLESYCEEDLKSEIAVFEKFLKKYPWEKWSPEEIKIWTKSGLEIYKLRALYLIQKNQLERAEKEISYYLNLSGKYLEGEELFFKLAEGYFKIGKRDQAKRFYELLITEWDLTKSALFSKFRLYQIVYERAPIKKLLPSQTVRDLLFYISQIKSKYSEEEIAEEAHLVETRVFTEEKEPEKAYLSAVEFINKYGESKFLPEVLQTYCKNFSQFLNSKIVKSELIEVFNLEKLNKEYIERSKCGEVYYSIGEIFWNYGVLNSASYTYIKAWEQGISKDLEPFLYFKLAFLAKETGEEEIFKDLLRLIEKRYFSLFKEDPLYTYLKFFYELENNLPSAERFLSKLINSSLKLELKRKALVSIWHRCIILKNYEKALEYLQNPYFPLQPENFIVLLSETLENKPKLFPKVLEKAKEKYPENVHLKWIEAYFLEREGKIEKALSLWKDLAENLGLEGELAKSYNKWQELVEKSRKISF